MNLKQVIFCAACSSAIPPVLLSSCSNTIQEAIGAASVLLLPPPKVGEITHVHTTQAAKRSRRSECEVGGWGGQAAAAVQQKLEHNRFA